MGFLRSRERDVTPGPIQAPEPPSGRGALPRGLRRFYDAYDARFRRDALGWMRDMFEAWKGERVAETSKIWQERTQLITDHAARTEAAVAAHAKAVGDVAAAATKLAADVAGLVDRVAAVEARPAPMADEKTIRRLKEVEDRLDLLTDARDGTFPPDDDAGDFARPATQELLRRIAKLESRAASATPKKRPTPDPGHGRAADEDEDEDGNEDGDVEGDDEREEPATARKKKRHQIYDDEQPARAKPQATSTWPLAEEMLRKIPPGKTLNLPRFVWALVEEEGAASRNRIADVLRQFGQRAGLDDVETAARAMGLVERRNQKNEPVYSIGLDSVAPK